MSLKVAIQMDPIETIHFDKDTSLVLGLEAQKRGFELYYYTPDTLSLKNGEVMAKAHKITLKLEKDNYFRLGGVEDVNLKDMDVVLMRQDPPFDMNYLSYTYFLEKIHPHTLVVNNPTEVRNCPEKLFVTEFSQFTPKTLITADIGQINDFYKEHKNIILKPVYAHGGADVLKIDNNLFEAAESLLKKYKTPIIAQEFLVNIAKGDKRIMLIDGEFAGALNRIPQEGQIVSNLAAGGTAVKTSLTKREEQICEALKPELKKRGLILAGIDVIDGFMTEINVTSPTGIQAINRLNGAHLEEKFWDVVESKL